MTLGLLALSRLGWAGTLQRNWVQVSPVTAPPGRYDHALAFDSARGRTVLFGGRANDLFFSDTWAYDGTTWTQASPATSPSPRQGHALAYDSARRRIVLFGGYDGTNNLSDTWEYDGTTWLQKNPATSPQARIDSGFAYDSGRGRTVLFGGFINGNGSYLSDTWEWDGINWAQKSPATSPPARYGHALVYDSARGRSVLFGGQSSLRYLSDTWEYDGTTWSQKNPATSPQARIDSGFAYDSERGRIVLFGGFYYNGSYNYLFDTWEYDATTWTQKSPATSPPARYGHALAYDSARGQTVLFGGWNGYDRGGFSDTWELPSFATPITIPGLSRTVNLGTVVKLDGSASGVDELLTATYSWARSTASPGTGPSVSLSGSSTTTATFTPAVFGTYTFTLTVSDQRGVTSTSAATAAVTITANAVPTVTAGPDRSVHAGVPVTLVATASDADSDPLTYQWTRIGGSGPTVSLSGVTSCVASFASLTTGTYSFAVTVSDGRGGSAVAPLTITLTNTQPTVTSGPDRSVHAGNLVVLTATGSDADGDPLTYSWARTGGNGPAVTLTGSTSSVASFTSLVTGTYTFGVTVADGRGGLGTASLTITLTDTPPTAFAIAGAQTVNVNTPVPITATASDPDGDPLSLSWSVSGPDSGSLVGGNSLTPVFTPTAGGTYTLTLTVNDGRGGIAIANLSLKASSIPVPNAGTNQLVNVGTLVTLSGAASTNQDGSTFTYSWAQSTGPPATLTGASTPTATFTPSVYGTYGFLLTVTNSLGGSAHASVNVVVNSVPVVSTPPRITTSINRNVLLQATASDADGDSLSYLWTRTDNGPGVQIFNVNTSTANFTPVAAATYSFLVTVNDGRGGTASTSVTVVATSSTSNTPPVGSAGQDRMVLPGVPVTLVATGSDPDGDTLSYLWTQSSGPTVKLINATSATASFATTVSGLYSFTVTITDGRGGFYNSSVNIRVNSSPVVSAGGNLLVNLGGPVTLQGSAHDPDGDAITYSWARTGGSGSPISLADANSAVASFTPPGWGMFVFALTATDSFGNSQTSSATVTVNAVPVLTVTPPQTVLPGTVVTLAASATDADGDPLTFSWARTGGNGPAVHLSNPSGTFTQFTAAHSGRYMFTVSVSDGRGGIVTAPVTVTANTSPTATMGATLTVPALSAVFLSASGSDPDGDPLTYQWQRAPVPGSGPGVTLYDGNTPTPNFTPIVPGTYAFQVAVSDGIATACATQAVNVLPASTQQNDHPTDFDAVTDNDDLSTDGTAATAKTDYPGDIDFFRFSAAGGQVYEIDLVSGQGLMKTTMALSVFDPLRRLVAHAESSSGSVSIPQFRPQASAWYFVQVATVGSSAVGSFSVSVRGSGTVTVPLPPRLSISFTRTGNSLDASIATSGTTIPLSALTVLLEYDSRHLTLLDATPGPAASAFNLAPQQFTLPFLGLGFQSKEAGFVAVPSGILAQVSFGVKEDSDRLDSDLSIGRAVATFPAGFGDALRPAADPGKAPFFSAARVGTKGKQGLYPDPVALPSDNLRPFVRLDARASLDSNANTQNLAYHWTQVSGPQIVLSDPTSPMTTFVPAGTPGRYVFNLVVDNGVLSSPPRQLVLSVDEAGSIPVATARLQVPASGRSAGALEPPLAVAQGTSVVLDASQSTHPIASFRNTLKYSWTQLGGLSSLALSNATTIPIATDTLLGTYKVSLSVSDTLGRTSIPETLSFVVAPPAQAPLSLRIFSSASGVSTTGADATEESRAPPTPLPIPVGSNVTFTARATAPSVIAGQTKLVFRWKQVSGPVDNARQTDGQTANNTQSTLSFTAKVPGLRRYRCEVAEQDLGSNPTGQADSRVIDVAVNSIAFVVPMAKAAIGAKGSTLAQPSVAGSSATTLPTGTLVMVDARSSTTPTGQVLAYHWTQVDGPPVTLSNPFAPVTTFVLPDLGDQQPRNYGFQLFVQTGDLASDTVGALLTVVPLTEGTLVLQRGLNFVGLRLNPSTPGHAYTAGDLLRDCGATWVAVPDPSSGRMRFRVFTTAQDPSAPPLQGASGYLMFQPTYRAVVLPGLGWPAASATLSLITGLNSLSYPFGAPSGEAASTLASRTGSSVVLRLGAPDAVGHRHFQPYLSSLSADYPLSQGEGYLVSVPSARRVTLPAGQ